MNPLSSVRMPSVMPRRRPSGSHGAWPFSARTQRLLGNKLLTAALAGDVQAAESLLRLAREREDAVATANKSEAT